MFMFRIFFCLGRDFTVEERLLRSELEYRGFNFRLVKIFRIAVCIFGEWFRSVYLNRKGVGRLVIVCLNIGSEI